MTDSGSSYSGSSSSSDEIRREKAKLKNMQKSSSPIYQDSYKKVVPTNPTSTTIPVLHSQFEQRSYQLDAASKKVNDYQEQYRILKQDIEKKDARINDLQNELQNLDVNRPKYEAKDRELQAKVQKRREKLAQHDKNHRALVDEVRKKDHEVRGHHEKIGVFEHQIIQARENLEEIQATLHPEGLKLDRVVAEVNDQIKEVRVYNGRLMADIKTREADVLKLRAEYEKSLQIHRMIKAKDEEIKELLKAQFELHRAFEVQKHTTLEKQNELKALEAEVRSHKQRYLHAKKANALLLKKLVVVTRDSFEAEQQDLAEEGSDEELAEVRVKLQTRVKELGLLFSDQQLQFEKTYNLPHAEQYGSAPAGAGQAGLYYSPAVTAPPAGNGVSKDLLPHRPTEIHEHHYRDPSPSGYAPGINPKSHHHHHHHHTTSSGVDRHSHSSRRSRRSRG